MKLIFKKISHFLLNIRDFFTHYREYLKKTKKTLCRIEEINVSQQKVIIYCRTADDVINLTFSQAIADIKLITNLPPNQASWLGAYYGKALVNSIQNVTALKKARQMSFLLTNTRGRYTISSEKRTGEIKYYDKKYKREYLEHPITIASNDYIISEFDSTQACYIGILAGICMENTKVRDERTGQQQLEILLKKPPKLRFVE